MSKKDEMNLFYKLKKINELSDNRIIVKIDPKYITFERKEQIQLINGFIECKLSSILTYYRSEDNAKLIKPLHEELFNIVLKSIAQLSFVDNKIEKAYDTIMEFEKSGYKAYSDSLWASAFIDPEGYYTKISKITESELNLVITDYCEKKKLKEENEALNRGLVLLNLLDS